MRAPLRLMRTVAALMLAASVLGLGVDGLYRDNAMVRAAWLGTDLVTLVLVVPLLVAAATLAARGSSRAWLLGLGAMAYALYDYAFYLFGAAYNGAFLLYAAIVSLATAGLIAGLATPGSRRLAEATFIAPLGTTVRLVAASMALISVTLAAVWIGFAIRHLLTGRLPPIVAATDHPTNVTAALDLWMVVTPGLWGSVRLARGRRWGHVVAAVWAVGAALYMVGLTASTLVMHLAGVATGLGQAALWITIGGIATTDAVVLLRGVPRRQTVGTRAEGSPTDGRIP
ncbi:MAG: hypothetical protein PVJ80_13485 [Gemmatimonadota bacterium]